MCCHQGEAEAVRGWRQGRKEEEGGIGWALQIWLLRQVIEGDVMMGFHIISWCQVRRPLDMAHVRELRSVPRREVSGDGGGGGEERGEL